jgi:hypothetical protein
VQLLLVTWVAQTERERDPFGQQPAGDKPKRLRGDPVEPLSVIDDREQRPALGHLGHQTEHRQPDQESVRRFTGADTERCGQGVALRRG